MAKTLTTEEFIHRARAIHGDIYDYSKTVYVKSSHKVEIICPKHESFFKTPNNHLRGQGCTSCGNERGGAHKSRAAAADFIEKARYVHGERYDYSMVDYKGATAKIAIICPDHGTFYQQPSNHLSGNGCKGCAAEKRSSLSVTTPQDFWSSVRNVHGERYGYERAEYKNKSSMLTITCRIHGDFLQKAGYHANGSGCPICHGKKSNTSDFVKKAQKVHGDFYVYDKTEYISAIKNVIISCPSHGDFLQSPNSHLNGRGCAECGREKHDQLWSIGVDEFIRRSIETHGDKYGYIDCGFKSLKDKVRITCPAHGEFWQRANSHMRVSGCPSCPSNGKRYHEPSAVYVLESGGGCKIGVAVEPSVRISRLKCATPFEITGHSHYMTTDWFAARSIESAIHREIADRNCGYTGFDGATEWFSISPDEAIALVKRHVADHQPSS